MNIFMNHAPGAGSIAGPDDQQSIALPLYHGCLVLNYWVIEYSCVVTNLPLRRQSKIHQEEKKRKCGKNNESQVQGNYVMFCTTWHIIHYTTELVLWLVRDVYGCEQRINISFFKTINNYNKYAAQCHISLLVQVGIRSTVVSTSGHP